MVLLKLSISLITAIRVLIRAIEHYAQFDLASILRHCGQLSTLFTGPYELNQPHTTLYPNLAQCLQNSPKS